MRPCFQGTLLRVLRACAVTFAFCPLCTLGATSVHVRRAFSSCPRGSVQVSSVCKVGLAAGAGTHHCGSQKEAVRGCGFDGMRFPAHTSAVTFLPWFMLVTPSSAPGAMLTHCPCTLQSCPSCMHRGRPSPWYRWALEHTANGCRSGRSPSICKMWTGRGRCSTGQMTMGRCCVLWGTLAGERPLQLGCQVRPYGVMEGVLPEA